MALDDDVIELVRDFAPLVERWASGTGTPFTLAHLDFRPDNFLFGVEPGAPPLVVVDWQTITFGPGTHDLAYMIGGGFEPEDTCDGGTRPRRRLLRPLARGGDRLRRRMRAGGTTG